MSTTIETAMEQMKGWLAARSQTYRGVLVACSGGIDSMTLATLCLRLRDEGSLTSPIGLAHVNFGLRGAESDGDQQFIEEFAKAHGLSCLVHTVSAEERDARSGESTQEWARRIRRDWFSKLGRERQVVAVAHNQNDVAETVLMRLSRGSAVGQMAGMRPWKAPIWRPLLNVPRSAIADFAARQNVPHREDSSNATLDYSRNRIRHTVLAELEALYPGAAERIASTAFEARDIVAYTRARLIKEASSMHDQLEGVWLRALPFGVAIEALSYMIKKHAVTHVQLSRTVLYQIMERVEQAGRESVRWGIETPGGVYVEVAADQVSFAKAGRTPFPARAQQHQRNLQVRRLRVLLEPGATIEVAAATSNEWDVIACLDPTKPVTLRLETLNANEALIFYGEDRSWDPRKLVRRWELAEKPEKVYKRVYRSVWVENNLIGLYDGNVIAKPNEAGDKVPIMPTKTVLRTFRRSNAL